MTHSIGTLLLKKWLTTPPLAGWRASLGAIAAVAIPTLLRLSVDGMVMGVAFSPYFPFVILSAVLMGSRPAVAVALAAAAVADALFVVRSPVTLMGAADIFGILAFLLSSVLVIFLVQAGRILMRDCAQPGIGDRFDGIVFSLKSGHAWVSWYGAAGSVRLGPQNEVAEMMEDFLAQLEVGKRLTERSSGETRSAHPECCAGLKPSARTSRIV